jgi:hypothetical protein
VVTMTRAVMRNGERLIVCILPWGRSPYVPRSRLLVFPACPARSVTPPWTTAAALHVCYPSPHCISPCPSLAIHSFSYVCPLQVLACHRPTHAAALCRSRSADSNSHTRAHAHARHSHCPSRHSHSHCNHAPEHRSRSAPVVQSSLFPSSYVTLISSPGRQHQDMTPSSCLHPLSLHSDTHQNRSYETLKSLTPPTGTPAHARAVVLPLPPWALSYLPHPPSFAAHSSLCHFVRVLTT